MKPERWSVVRRVLEEARDREGADRQAYLDTACGDDRELRAEVSRLLSIEDSAPPLAAPAADELHAALAGPALAHDQDVDGHRLVRVIASGGMGTVWEAEQLSPHRTVALKVMRSGLHSDAARARFHHETEVLARLGHPAIARLFAAGVQRLADGRELPWYTMELVEGARTLHAHAQEHGLDLRERLELFEQICDAVHHAHLNGVIHRDLKGGNILVDDQGRPRVIDFGVARSVDPDVTRHETHAGEIVGTLHAMAPEQLEGRVDARSDVYALGVVLYELLCQRLPLELDSRSFTDVVRTIKHDLPTPPSLHAQELPTELDWVVARALEKRPADRYPSAAALAADVQRWLEGQAVSAGAPGPLYHARVFVRRHRVTVTAGVLVLGALIAGMVGTTRGLLLAQRSEQAARRSADEAGHQRDLALQAAEEAASARREAEQAHDLEIAARRDAEAAQRLEAQARQDADVARLEEQRQRVLADQARGRAETEATTARAAMDLLLDLFQSPDPRVSGHDVSVVAALRSADALLAERLVDAPEAEAELRLALGRLHMNLSLFEEALGHLDLAVSKGSHGGLEADDLENARQWRGVVLLELGRADEAEAQLSADLARRTERFGSDHPRTAGAQSALARVFIERSRFAEAEQLLVHAIATDIDHLGVDDLSTLVDISSLGSLYQTQGRLTEAGALLEEAVRRSQARHANDPRFLGALSNLAMNRAALGRPREALPLARQVLEARRQLLAPQHDLTLLSLANLAAVLITLGELEEAGDLLQESSDLRVEHFPRGTFDSLATALTLALVRLRQGDVDAFVAALDRALEDHAASSGDVLRAATSFEHLAVELHMWCLRNGRRDLYDQAARAMEPALAIRSRVLGPDHPQTLTLQVRLFSWQGGLGDVEGGLAGLDGLRARAADSGDLDLLGGIDHERGAMLADLGRFEEAEAALLPWVSHFDATVDGESFRDTVASLYEAWGRDADAEAMRRGP